MVTYVSADGAFGGPVAVAAGHAEELARRGHEVEILAGWDGKRSLQVPGVTVRLFRTRKAAPGLSGLTAPQLLRYLRGVARSFDVVHVHLGRDLVTLPAALVANGRAARVVVQTHGMIMPDSRFRARILDSLATRRVLRRAATVFVLTPAEKDGLIQVSGRESRITEISNGIRDSVSVSSARDDPPVVLFLARLHERKRVLAFAEAALILSRRPIDVDFRVIGPDEGDLPALMKFKIANQVERLRYDGAIPPGEAARELSKAAVYVLPSYGEVFPMTVLEAFSVGTPVVLCDQCAIAPELAARGAVELTNGEGDDIARAVESLLTNPERRASLSAAGTNALSNWLSVTAVVDRLEEAYA